MTYFDQILTLLLEFYSFALLLWLLKYLINAGTETLTVSGSLESELLSFSLMQSIMMDLRVGQWLFNWPKLLDILINFFLCIFWDLKLHCFIEPGVFDSNTKNETDNTGRVWVHIENFFTLSSAMILHGVVNSQTSLWVACAYSIFWSFNIFLLILFLLSLPWLMGLLRLSLSCYIW